MYLDGPINIVILSNRRNNDSVPRKDKTVSLFFDYHCDIKPIKKDAKDAKSEKRMTIIEFFRSLLDSDSQSEQDDSRENSDTYYDFFIEDFPDSIEKRTSSIINKHERGHYYIWQVRKLIASIVHPIKNQQESDYTHPRIVYKNVEYPSYRFHYFDYRHILDPDISFLEKIRKVCAGNLLCNYEDLTSCSFDFINDIDSVRERLVSEYYDDSSGNGQSQDTAELLNLFVGLQNKIAETSSASSREADSSSKLYKFIDLLLNQSEYNHSEVAVFIRKLLQDQQTWIDLIINLIDEFSCEMQTLLGLERSRTGSGLAADNDAGSVSAPFPEDVGDTAHDNRNDDEAIQLQYILTGVTNANDIRNMNSSHSSNTDRAIPIKYLYRNACDMICASYFKIIQLINSIEDVILTLFVNIIDIYVVRKILDKNYCRNAIVYSGSSHCINYVRFLIQFGGFEIKYISHENVPQQSSGKAAGSHEKGDDQTDPDTLTDLVRESTSPIEIEKYFYRDKLVQSCYIPDLSQFVKTVQGQEQ